MARSPPASRANSRRWLTAGTNFGRLPLSRQFERAAGVAEGGISPQPHLRVPAAETAASLARFPASRAIFLKSDGAPWVSGDRLVQRDLANTYRSLATNGRTGSTGGPFADHAVTWMRENQGLLTRADFASY